MKDDLREFISAWLPLLEYTMNNPGNKYGFKEGFFYGLESHFQIKIRISAGADVLARELGINDLSTMVLSKAEEKFKDKKYGDKLKERGKERLFRHRLKQNKCFHYEHVVTGKMVWNKMHELWKDSKLSIEYVEPYMRNNLCVAWILSEEDLDLDKSGSGTSLDDGLARYKNAGIKLL